MNSNSLWGVMTMWQAPLSHLREGVYHLLSAALHTIMLLWTKNHLKDFQAKLELGMHSEIVGEEKILSTSQRKVPHW